MQKKLFYNRKFKILEKDIQTLGQKIKYWKTQSKYLKLYNKKKFQLCIDIKIDKILKKKIIKLFGKQTIVSEENKKKINVDRISNYWLLDPIDGSRSLFGGFEGYVIQLCYIANKEVIYSLIYAPEKSKIWVGIKNKGVFINNKTFNKKINRNRIIIDNYKKPTGISKFLMKKLNFKKYYESGSIGLKSCLVAEGMADLFVKDIVYKDWDIFPSLLIHEELGSNVCDFKGNPLKLKNNFVQKNGLIVTRSKKLLERIKYLLKKNEKKNSRSCCTS
jgi:3'(2'), 5'-bisphosphate nucleotidase